MSEQYNILSLNQNLGQNSPISANWHPPSWCPRSWTDTLESYINAARLEMQTFMLRLHELGIGRVYHVILKYADTLDLADVSCFWFKFARKAKALGLKGLRIYEPGEVNGLHAHLLCLPTHPIGDLESRLRDSIPVDDGSMALRMPFKQRTNTTELVAYCLKAKYQGKSGDSDVFKKKRRLFFKKLPLKKVAEFGKLYEGKKTRLKKEIKDEARKLYTELSVEQMAQVESYFSKFGPTWSKYDIMLSAYKGLLPLIENYEEEHGIQGVYELLSG